MKLMILGGTGNVGSAVVRMAVRYPSVRGIVHDHGWPTPPLEPGWRS